VYTVALTVFASDGTSIGTAANVVAGTLTPPAVTKLSPNKGPAEGGNLVKITGSRFTGATAVHFGALSAGFFVQSSTTILAEAPAASPGTVEVTVTAPGGTSAASTADRYKYTPTVTALSPSAGPRAGGTTVTVTGTGFATGTTGTIFKFGSVKAGGVNCSSTTSCTVVSPAHEAGTVDVKATVNKVASPKSAPGDQFTFS
jgi:hypothetical protein